jgi:hypothetical protein
VEKAFDILAVINRTYAGNEAEQKGQPGRRS